MNALPVSLILCSKATIVGTESGSYVSKPNPSYRGMQCAGAGAGADAGAGAGAGAGVWHEKLITMVSRRVSMSR